MITREQVQRYFESRLPGQRLNFNLKNVPARCPFHDDQLASLSIHSETGRWRCHGCGARGQLLDFEKHLGGNPEAVANACGIPLDRIPEAVYSYTDAFGGLLFEKIRFPGKKFLSRRRSGGGWVWNLDGVADKPLYQLRRLVTARFVFVCNGEKAADALNEALDRAGETESCATCTFDGEGKWRGEYAKYFTGKAVSVFPDNDQVGRDHAAEVARSLAGVAHVVKVVELEGLPEKGDVYDYLQTHPLADLLGKVKETPPYRVPVQTARRMFVPAEEFLSRRPAKQTDWIVQGCIQRGGNGMIVAPPGAGKSYIMFDLAISLATQSPFLGIEVPHRLKVAVMSREDHPDLTRWRLQHIWSGKRGVKYADLDHLYLNTREDLPQFYLDDDSYLIPVMENLEEFQPDIVFFDVLKVMHGSEENDNTAMHKVMSQVTNLTTKLKCAACIVHHEGYSGRVGSLKGRARGASAIGGWPEWVMAIGITNPTDPQREWIRKIEMESKAGPAHDPVEFVIWSDVEDGPITLKPVKETVVAKKPEKPVQMPLDSTIQ